MKGKDHELQTLHGQTLYLPHATSLRMSDLGYSTTAQSSLAICFNHLDTYIASLDKAINSPYPPYEEIGVKVDGKYRQLSTNILQIENEYYSDIRPKRVILPAERHLQALRKRGVEYVEVRHTDVNPFLPAGIDSQQARFIDIFLISCLLMEGDEITQAECETISGNMQKVVTRGREPGLTLITSKGEATLVEAGRMLVGELRRTGEMMDQVHGVRTYSGSVDFQMHKVEDPSLTPSARVLDALQETGMGYSEWIVHKSREHKETFLKLTPPASVMKACEREAAFSVKKQKLIEAGDTVNFDQFLEEYLG